MFRSDRSAEKSGAAHGGGALVAVRRAWRPLARPSWPAPPRSSAECVWVSIPLSKSTQLNIACLYIPHGPGYREGLSSFFETASQILLDRPNDLFLITGDFNISEAEWIVDRSQSDTFVDPILLPSNN